MTSFHKLAVVADELLPEYGRELDKVKRRGKLSREEYPRIFRRIVGRYYPKNRKALRRLGYKGPNSLGRDLEPYFLQAVDRWFTQEVVPHYSGGENDAAEFYKRTAEAFSEQSPGCGQDLWKGVLRATGSLLYPVSNEYRRTVEYSARYFVKVGLVADQNEALEQVRTLHYEALYDDVLVPKTRGPNVGKPRMIDELGPRHLKDKVDKCNRDYASRPGTLDLEAAEKAYPNALSHESRFDAALEEKQLFEVLRERLESTGKKRQLEVLEAMTLAYEKEEHPTSTSVSRPLGIRRQTASVHVKAIRDQLREIS